MPSILSTISLFAASAYAASLTQVTDFGDNPGNCEMYMYAPDNVAESPAVILAVCPSPQYIYPSRVYTHRLTTPTKLAPPLWR